MASGGANAGKFEFSATARSLEPITGEIATLPADYGGNNGGRLRIGVGVSKTANNAIRIQTHTGTVTITDTGNLLGLEACSDNNAGTTCGDISATSGATDSTWTAGDNGTFTRQISLSGSRPDYSTQYAADIINLTGWEGDPDDTGDNNAISIVVDWT